MHSLGFWNVRGLNDLNKQKVVKWFMYNNGVGLFGLIETKIKPSSLLKTNTSLCDGWSITTNCSWHKGGRIWVLWNPKLFDIQILEYGSQYIHMKVYYQIDNRQFLLTMIYAFNGLNDRVELWNFLKEVADTCSDPWLWLGDFNTVLSPVERLGGSTSEAEMEHFQECVSLCGMEDLIATGALYTWSNKQQTTDRVYSRLDRAMGNQEWLDNFGDYMAHFHPEGLFDHCPCTIVDRKADFGCRRSFKYFNMWGRAEAFMMHVAFVWRKEIRGTKMYTVVKKLKALKPVLKSLNKECFADIENSTLLAGKVLDAIQRQLVDAPDDTDLLQQEYDLSTELKGLTSARDSFLTQKAKIQWSLSRDLNTSYFHNVIKKRIMLNKVIQIDDKAGLTCTTAVAIQDAFLDYYKDLPGSQAATMEVNMAVVRRGNSCVEEHWALLHTPITLDEIKHTLFSIPATKSPGPDGFTSQFFKDDWDIVGVDVSKAILNFFDTGQLLSELNATVITLIPKLDRPSSVKHFRPISCCNVLYKTISKILCTRLAKVLPLLISRNQGAFIKGRSILENILICQDLVRMYNRSMVSPRCMFKLDLQKAYDSIEWGFLEQMLMALRFPETFTQLIMTCVSSPSYTLSLNGAQFGFFKGRRGLRQGDPLSPLLFCICMEYLSRVMEFAVTQWPFRFHPMCKPLKLTHLLFADDLLMFSRGDHMCIMLILRVLATFAATSGLRVNAAKSEVVFNGVTDELKQDITSISGYQEGNLPFKYLGVPIQPGRLQKHDCNILIERMVARIKSIGARKLSYAGRIVLINSVLNTLHNYWSSIFLLPKGVVNRVEALCRNFLWSNAADYQRTPLVAWDNVCCSKKEGGLGIKKAGVWNVAVVGKLVHWIYTKADRLWVLWIDHVYLKGADWTSYVPPSDSTWTWRNISKHRVIGWLIQRQALNTRAKLFQLGISDTKLCVLCEQDEETHLHLFQFCSYCLTVLNGVERWLKLPLTKQVRTCSTFKRKVWRVARMHCWYLIWQ
ncbi:hypothetical protein vseg_017658 [Gypsophila vaccaria]